VTRALWTGRASTVCLRADRGLWPIFWSLDDNDSAVVALNRENFDGRRSAARAQQQLLGHGDWNGKTCAAPEASTGGEIAGLLVAERPKKWSSSGRSSGNQVLAAVDSPIDKSQTAFADELEREGGQRLRAKELEPSC
jgi:hypothetical protein